VGCGQEHNEAAWAARLPDAYTFLLNIQDEANLLAQRENPPELVLTVDSNQTICIATDSLKGQRYLLERTGQLTPPQWQAVSTSDVENLLWSSTTLTDTQAMASSAYFRVVAEP